MIKTELNGINVWLRIEELRQRDLNLLAPKFKDAVEAAVAEIAGRSIRIGTIVVPLDVVIFETARTNELQQIYYSQGTSKAKTAEKSWHYYGLAIDVISQRYEWFDNKFAKETWPNRIERMAAAEKWFLAVGGFFEEQGCKLGAKWKHQDLPHIQWGRCKDSPDDAIEIYKTKGLQAVWEAVKAT